MKFKMLMLVLDAVVPLFCLGAGFYNFGEGRTDAGLLWFLMGYTVMIVYKLDRLQERLDR